VPRRDTAAARPVSLIDPQAPLASAAMEAALVLLVIVVATSVVVAVLRNREARRRHARVEPAGGPAALGAGAAATVGGTDVRALRPGDVVMFESRDWIVEGTVRFDEGGFTWAEHRLVDGGDSIWLSVEDDDGLEVVVWERVTGVALEPGAATLAHGGVDYALDERGRASFTSEGATGAPGGGRMEYADYEAGDRRLAFERYSEDSSWEISVGRVVPEHALDIYPAGGAQR
jgi:uncharacterized protein DUF4178